VSKAAGKPLEPVSWDEWFADFDAGSMAFVCTEQTDRGEVSRHYKFVGRDTFEARSW
jgi:hypothetical protein